MVDQSEGRRPENRPSEKKGADSELPGWQPKEKAAQLPKGKRNSRNSVGGINAEGEGPQRPQCAKGRGPKDLGVAAPLAAAGCRGNCWRVVDGRRGKTDLRTPGQAHRGQSFDIADSALSSAD